MTFKRRIFFDRMLAVPLAVAINGVVRILGLILRREHSIEPSITRHIVVCKLVGLGSILQATPLLRALRQRFPNARITFLTLKGNSNLVHRLEGVDNCLWLDDGGAARLLWTTLRALWTLSTGGVDHYFDLEVYSGFTCLLSVFSLARNRFGFYRHSNRFKRGIYTHLVYFNTRMPIRGLYLQLGRNAGTSADADDHLGPIRIQPEEGLSLRRKLADLGVPQDAPFVLVNPNASDLLVERRWPVGYFVETIIRLADLGHNVVLMGAPSEASFVTGIAEAVPIPLRAKVFNTAGMLSLGELLALIEQAECVLTNDTGPMHMVFALGRPAVCLVGPAEPVHYGMEMPGVVTLYAPVSCSPCIYEVDFPPCHGRNICMQRLSPQLALEHILALIASQRSGDPLPSGLVRLPLVWENDAGEPLGSCR